jgi:hypothetical protein
MSALSLAPSARRTRQKNGEQCGFYPGCAAGEHRAGSAPRFDQARSDFKRAWRTFSARRTETDYQAWRDQRDWTTRKHAMRDRGVQVPLR